jgi:hypothetical protein
MEVWKNIFNDYAISNIGNLKSLKYGKEKLLKLQKDKKGYLRVRLTINGKGKEYRLHRLVAMAFIENLENKEQVNHINGLKDDNRVENLEWATNLENIKHAHENNLIDRSGVKNSHAKLSESQVLEIRNSQLSYSELATQYNVNRHCIYKIKKGITWSHI